MEEQRRRAGAGPHRPLADVLNRLPTDATTGIFGSMLRGVDFVTSNVPGPPIPVYLRRRPGSSASSPSAR